MMNINVSQIQLKEMIHYCPESGAFTWIDCKQKRNNGKVIKSSRGKGYLSVKINQVPVYLHRLAWFYMTGAFPDGFIDHINRDRKDNRFSNLRVVSASGNQYNKSKAINSSSKFIGVYKHTNANRWIAQISTSGKGRHIGCYKTEEEAYAAYLRKKAELHIIP